MTLNVVTLKPPTGEPNPRMVELFEQVLAKVKSGELQSFIGTGFAANGERLTVWADNHDNAFEMMGALAVLQAEYLHRHSQLNT